MNDFYLLLSSGASVTLYTRIQKRKTEDNRVLLSFLSPGIPAGEPSSVTELYHFFAALSFMSCPLQFFICLSGLICYKSVYSACHLFLFNSYLSTVVRWSKQKFMINYTNCTNSNDYE